MSSTNQKDIVYVDVDDEITSIIDKITKSKSKIIALVLPKRAVVLQSIVNLKLLKRASDDQGKRTVLISSDQTIIALAGAVGMYVAKNLQSKPEIPPAPDEVPASDEDNLLEAEEESVPEPLNKEKTVGELAGENEAVFESDQPKDTPPQNTNRKKSNNSKQQTGGKKNKVPNFDSFRKKAIIGSLVAVGMVVFAYFAIFVAPKATVTITTETSTANNSIDFVASTAVKATKIEDSKLASKEVKETKTETQKTPATGQKDLGAKATGSVLLSIPCGSVSGSPPTVPAGTGVSTGGLTYITNSSSSLTTPSFGLGCKFTSTVAVTAQANGEQYNIDNGKSFTVAGFSSVTGSNSSAFTGGSSKIAKVVSQQDVDSAKQKLTDTSGEVKDQLKQQLESAGYYALVDTFTTESDKIDISPEVGEEATEVTVNAERIYVMIGIKFDDLKLLVKQKVQPELDSKSMQIKDDGIDKAIIRVGTKQSNGDTPITLQAQTVLGPKIDENQVKQDIAGKKRGDAQEIIKRIEGVKEAKVEFSPFWVNIIPKNTAKVSIRYEEAKE